MDSEAIEKRTKIVKGYISRGVCDQQNERYREARQMYEDGLKAIARSGPIPNGVALQEVLNNHLSVLTKIEEEIRTKQEAAAREAVEYLKKYLKESSDKLIVERQLTTTSVCQLEVTERDNLTQRFSFEKEQANYITNQRLLLEKELNGISTDLLDEVAQLYNQLRHEEEISRSLAAFETEKGFLSNICLRSISCLSVDEQTEFNALQQQEHFSRRSAIGCASVIRQLNIHRAQHVQERFNTIVKMISELHRLGSEHIKLEQTCSLVDILNEEEDDKFTLRTVLQQKQFQLSLFQLHEQFQVSRVVIVDDEQTLYEGISSLMTANYNLISFDRYFSQLFVLFDSDSAIIVNEENEHFMSLVQLQRTQITILFNKNICDKFVQDCLADTNKIQKTELLRYTELIDKKAVELLEINERAARREIVLDERITFLISDALCIMPIITLQEQQQFNELISSKHLNSIHLATSRLNDEYLETRSVIEEQEQQSYIRILCSQDVNSLELSFLNGYNEIKRTQLTSFTTLLDYNHYLTREILTSREQRLMSEILFESNADMLYLSFLDGFKVFVKQIQLKAFNEIVKEIEEEKKTLLEHESKTLLVKQQVVHCFHQGADLVVVQESDCRNVVVQARQRHFIALQEFLSFAENLSNQLSAEHSEIADEIQEQQVASFSEILNSNSDILKLNIKLVKKRVSKTRPLGRQNVISKIATALGPQTKTKLINNLRKNSSLNDILLQSCLIKKSDLVMTMDDVIGLNDVKRELLVKLQSDVPAAIISGASGCGKTALINAVAHKLQSHTVFNIQSQHILSNKFGETEKRVDALFQCAASLSPSLLIIDDAEALLGTSIIVHNAVERLRVAFKKNMDTIRGRNIAIVAATSKLASIDESILRRFSPVRVPLPGIELKQEYLIYLCETHPTIRISLTRGDVISVINHAPEFTLASIKSLFIDASMSASGDEVVTHQRLMQALHGLQQHY